MMLAALVLAACAGGAGDSKKANYAISAKDGGGEKAAFSFEVADTNEVRLQGFQHRKDVPAGTGMLFVFDRPDYHSMWMKNTLVPLDMIFLNDDRVVTSVAAGRVPLSEEYVTPCNVEYEAKVGELGEEGWDVDAFFDECEARFMKPDTLTRYVIEVPSGTAVEYGIVPGDVLTAK
jgi:uncharacterized membrane protein (UPF0127 family)